MKIAPAHWHLLLNHFPVILSIAGLGFLVAAMVLKKESLKFSALILIIAAGIFSYLAFQTGENAEESIEHIPGVSESAIQNHEGIANNGFRIAVITGIIALITIFVVNSKKKAANIFMIITLIATLSSVGYLSYVGYTGGEIRHSEIRGDLPFSNKNAPADQPAQVDEDEE